MYYLHLLCREDFHIWDLPLRIQVIFNLESLLSNILTVFKSKPLFSKDDVSRFSETVTKAKTSKEILIVKMTAHSTFIPFNALAIMYNFYI